VGWRQLSEWQAIARRIFPYSVGALGLMAIDVVTTGITGKLSKINS